MSVITSRNEFWNGEPLAQIEVKILALMSGFTTNRARL